jgi:hypothetical protein
MKRKLMYSIPIVALAALAPIGLSLAQEGADAENSSRWHKKTFTVYVAIDGASGTFNTADPGRPYPPNPTLRGDTLVVDGTIYPANHPLPSGFASNDPNEPGGIGRVLCRGVFLTSGADFTTPAITYITELYMFSDPANSLIADGIAPNFGLANKRPVLGGTGRFKYAVGELLEEELGANKSGGCNLKVTFSLRKAIHEGED